MKDIKNLIMTNAKFEKCESTKPIMGGIFTVYSAFHYIAHGYGFFNDVRLGPGQYFCAMKNHFCKYVPDAEEPWEYYFFELTGNSDDQLFLRYNIDPDKPYGEFLCIDEMPKLLQMYQQYKNRFLDDSEFYESLAGMLLTMHKAKPRELDIEPITHRHIREITDYIDRHCHLPLSVEDIAAHFYLSRKYLRNIFVQKLGLSPKQYLQKVRMENAAQLLKETEYDIGLIGSSVGYRDIYTFSKAFKMYYGKSPSVFRNT